MSLLNQSQAFRLLDLQPQDRVVIAESEPSYDYPPQEEVYYVDIADYNSGVVHALNAMSHHRPIPFTDIVDIQKATNPIVVKFPRETARIIRKPEYASRHVRAVSVDIFEGRIDSLCVRNPLSTDPRRWLSLPAYGECDDGSVVDHRNYVKNLPSRGFCVSRFGDQAAYRNRTYRTARGRVSRFITDFCCNKKKVRVPTTV